MAAVMSMNSLLNGKDSRWLQLEVCREFQRNKCSRSDTECKFAHPPANVEVQNGRVTACYDSIKGRCNREKPPCKYFHPPQHLKDQLLINGRNHLALKNALMQQMGLAPGQVLPAQMPTVGILPHQDITYSNEQWNLLQASNPYLAGVPAVGSGYSPYFTAGPLVPALVGHDPGAVPSPLAPAIPQQVLPTQKLPRSDRLEMDMKTVGSFYYENFAFPGMVPYKRAAVDKSGMPVYQPGTTYQQLMQLQQPFVPVSCEYPAPAPPTATSPRPPVQPSVTSPSTPPAPSPSPDPATVAKEVAQSNYAAKLAVQIPSAATVSPLTALTYTGVALNKQPLPSGRPTTVSAVSSSTPIITPTIAPTMSPAPTHPSLLYRQPSSIHPNYQPILRAQLQSQQLQLQNQIQAQQLQNHLASQIQSLRGQLPAQLQNQINGQLNGRLSSQITSSMQSQLGTPMAGQLSGQLSGQLPLQWTPQSGLSVLPQHLMPNFYHQPMLYPLPSAPIPTSTPSVILNPYKKMKTT